MSIPLGRRRKRIFTVTLAIREGDGGVSPLGPYRNQIWKFWPIFSIEIWFFDTQNTFYLIVKGLKNAFLYPFRLHYTAIRPYFDRAAASSKEEMEIRVVGWRWLFSCIKSVSEHM